MVGGLSAQLPSAAVRASEGSVWDRIDLGELNLLPIQHEAMSQWEAQEVQVGAHARLSLSLNLPLPFLALICMGIEAIACQQLHD